MRRNSEVGGRTSSTGSISPDYYRLMRELYRGEERRPLTPDPVGRGLPDADKLPASMDDLALSPPADPGALGGDVSDCTHASAALASGLPENRCSDTQGLLHIHDPPSPCAVCRGRVHLGNIKRLLDQHDAAVPADGCSQQGLNPTKENHDGNSQAKALQVGTKGAVE